MALVLSGLHAGPIAAHGNAHSPDAAVGMYDHGHGHDDHTEDRDTDDRSADMNAEPGHHHSPSGAAPQFPQTDLVLKFGKQVVYASDTPRLHSGVPAPPLDPPIA